LHAAAIFVSWVSRPRPFDANRRRGALRAGNETRQWEAGKTLVFCDATGHEAWNLGATERVVLLLDFRNSGFRWRWLDPDLTSSGIFAISGTT